MSDDKKKSELDRLMKVYNLGKKAELLLKNMGPQATFLDSNLKE